MPLYEHVFIARQDVSPQQVDQMSDAFKAILEENGGKVSMVESWGLRSLAYKIKKNRKGHYVRMNIEAPSDAVVEMERQMRIHDDVLRFLTVRVDELDPNPAALLSNRGGRDDRRGGGRGRDDRGPRRDDRGPRRDDRDDRPRRDRDDNKPAAASAE
jgi:small subunit ribosomal protein S6